MTNKNLLISLIRAIIKNKLTLLESTLDEMKDYVRMYGEQITGEINGMREILWCLEDEDYLKGLVNIYLEGE